MNVRMATINDAVTLVKVRFDYFTAEKWKLTDGQRASIRSQLRQYYSKHLNHDFFAAFVEDDSGNIISTAFLAISEVPANLSFPTGRTGMILNVLTYPGYRRMGYATKAMDMLIDEAKRQNLSYIELSASELGKPLYEKLGFHEPEPSAHFTKMKLSLL